jgi:hypothetical protein
MDRSDKALLAAYVLAAGLGIVGHSLLVNDGAVFLTASWLGNAWDLYFRQLAGRSVSTYLAFGPAQLVRQVVPLSASAFERLAHGLYFAAPLALWLCLRAVEPHRVFSRLYLAVVLALLYFVLETIVGIGLWLIWLALAADARRSLRQTVAATVLLGVAIVFTHPALIVVTLLYAVGGIVLGMFGRPLPCRSLWLAAGLFAILLAGNFLVGRWLPPTNPLISASFASGRQVYLDPVRQVAEIGRFPAIGVLWLLLIGPGLLGRFRPVSLGVLAVVGLWFAAAATNLLTYIVARYTAPYVLAVAVTLALAAPDQWLKNAQRGLVLYAAIAATTAVSYASDLLLFERYVDKHLVPGFVNVETLAEKWPEPTMKTSLAHMLFKWDAEPDYVRDVVVPTYDWYRLTLAFYSYFRSDRQSVLFHPTGRPGDWLPFRCPDVAAALSQARDETDRAFLEFLRGNLCVK